MFKLPRRRVAVVAASAALALAVSACSSSSSGSSGTDANGNQTFIMQTAPGSVLPYIGYVADKLGFFAKNHVNVKFATLTTGLSATAALNAGSLNLITADPASTGPLLAQGGNLKLILGEDLMQWQVLVPSSEAGKPFADIVKSLNVIGAPAASGGTASLTRLIEKAYGRPTGSIKVVADQSGAGVLSGAEQAIIVSPAFSCVLEQRGLTQAFSFAKPMESSYPKPLSDAIGTEDIAFWGLKSWADANPELVKNIQAALSEAIDWVNDPKNLDTWVTTMRGGSLNNTSLDDAQYKACLGSTQGYFNATFDDKDVQKWDGLVKEMGVLPDGLPDPSQWLDSGATTAK
jgi:ABC-type nitrate/sulfonate/bicarbonate transport system substrate-binding protein